MPTGPLPRVRFGHGGPAGLGSMRPPAAEYKPSAGGPNGRPGDGVGRGPWNHVSGTAIQR